MPRCTHRLSVDRAIDLLRSDCRRRIVRHLLDAPEGPVERRDLVAALHAELDRSPDSIRVELAHQHLPKLAACGVVEYDYRSGTVRPHRTLEALEPVLAACERLESRIQ